MAVTTKVLVNGSNRYAAVFTNDGDAETAVRKIEKAALNPNGAAPDAIRIVRARWNCSGMSVNVAFDHGSDDVALMCSGDGEYNGESYGPLHDGDTGGTGDVVFSTVGQNANDSYNVYLELAW